MWVVSCHNSTMGDINDAKKPKQIVRFKKISSQEKSFLFFYWL